MDLDAQEQVAPGLMVQLATEARVRFDEAVDHVYFLQDITPRSGLRINGMWDFLHTYAADSINYMWNHANEDHRREVASRRLGHHYLLRTEDPILSMFGRMLSDYDTSALIASYFDDEDWVAFTSDLDYDTINPCFSPFIKKVIHRSISLRGCVFGVNAISEYTYNFMQDIESARRLMICRTVAKPADETGAAWRAHPSSLLSPGQIFSVDKEFFTFHFDRIFEDTYFTSTFQIAQSIYSLMRSVYCCTRCWITRSETRGPNWWGTSDKYDRSMSWMSHCFSKVPVLSDEIDPLLGLDFD